MKIALFSRYPRNVEQPHGGVESVTVILAKALSQCEDVDLNILTMEKDQPKPLIEHNGNIRIHRLPGSSWPQVPDILFGPGKSQLKNYILRLRPDVFHSSEVYGLTFGDTPFPHVFTLHGFDHEEILTKKSIFSKPRSVIWHAIEKHGLSKLKHVICINPYVRKTIEPIINGRLYDIENPVDERFFNIRRNEKIGRILCVGWIIKRKNTLSSVQAFGKLVEQGFSANLVIAGHIRDRKYHRKIMNFIESHNLKSRIEFLGQIGRDSLLLELSKASVFLMPSLQETAPMAIAEAMAAGVPVIASNRCGMPYMVEEGHTGFLVDPTDGLDIANKLALVLGNDGLRRNMSVRARQIASYRFDANIVAAKTAEVYREILETRDH